MAPHAANIIEPYIEQEDGKAGKLISAVRAAALHGPHMISSFPNQQTQTPILPS